MSDVRIEVAELAIRGYHGATAEERRRGQTFLFDIEVVAHDAGIRSDQVADTVDYREIVACACEISDGRRFNLIEALAAAVADALVDRFPISRASVRVRKPDVKLDAPVAYAAATIERVRR